MQTMKFFTEEERIMYYFLLDHGFSPKLNHQIKMTIDGKETSIFPDFLIYGPNGNEIILEITTAFRAGYGRGHGNRTKIKITKRRRISELRRAGVNIIIMDIKCLIAVFTFFELPYTDAIINKISLFPKLSIFSIDEIPQFLSSINR